MALVEFFEAHEAKQAFHSLAYRKFKAEPLHLEVGGHAVQPCSSTIPGMCVQWAPVEVFVSAVPTKTNVDEAASAHEQAAGTVAGGSCSVIAHIHARRHAHMDTGILAKELSAFFDCQMRAILISHKTMPPSLSRICRSTPRRMGCIACSPLLVPYGSR
jgi:hypothetical protein